MAQAAGVTCDQCSRFVAVKLAPGKATLPPGWYEVYGVLTSGERTLIAEVCSAHCLGKLAKLRREVETPLASVSYMGHKGITERESVQDHES
jgi:hypothetical protein